MNMIPIDCETCTVRTEYRVRCIIGQRLGLIFLQNLICVVTGLLMIKLNFQSTISVRFHGKLLLKREKTGIDAGAFENGSISLIIGRIAIGLDSGEIALNGAI